MASKTTNNNLNLDPIYQTNFLPNTGTKDLAAPTIGIQTAANHYTFQKNVHQQHTAPPFCL